MKILWEDEDIQLISTEVDGLTFLHVEVYNFSKNLYKEKYLPGFFRLLKENNITTAYSRCHSDKAKKFNEMFGFEYLCDVEGTPIMELSL